MCLVVERNGPSGTLLRGGADLLRGLNPGRSALRTPYLKSQKVGRSASLGYFEHSASYRLPCSGMGLTQSWQWMTSTRSTESAGTPVWMAREVSLDTVDLVPYSPYEPIATGIRTTPRNILVARYVLRNTSEESWLRTVRSVSKFCPRDQGPFGDFCQEPLFCKFWSNILPPDRQGTSPRKQTLSS